MALLLKNDLNFGFSDAENYKRRENKELLNRFFIQNDYLEKLCSPATSFLVGEKGTGKTAYAVYLTNNGYKNQLSTLKYIRETDYQKFMAIKNQKQLGLSDYTSIWKVIILLMLSQQVITKEGGADFLMKFNKMNAVQKAIDEYYHRAFSPEIIQALEFVQESKLSAELLQKYAQIKGEAGEKATFSEERFQVNLMYIQRSFEAALNQVKLSHNHLLLIDGIDIRPESISYNDYLECIKGLANAIWEVNNDYFPTIRDSKGRLRVVLLVRPDIFQSLGLQNQNTKIRDNSVFLDWRTEYSAYRASGIFSITDHLLSSQQPAGTTGKAWDHYFPWDAPMIRDEFKDPTSFLAFLRWSYYRPRDIITMLKYLQDISKSKGDNSAHFTLDEFENAGFRRQYSDYLLGEIKDQLIFYYGSSEYETFLKFFSFLNGKNKFDYTEYKAAFKQFKIAVENEKYAVPKFMETDGAFLQFLYDLNVICYFEQTSNDKPYIRWCFRERSYANISPKVKEGVTYQIFYGLGKALNVGQEFVERRA